MLKNRDCEEMYLKQRGSTAGLSHKMKQLVNKYFF